VTDIDIVLATRRHLAEQEDLTALLGSGNGYDTWIFQNRLYVPVEQTGKAALLIRQQGSWSSPNAHNTVRFPMIVIEVYVDPKRDDLRNSVSFNLQPQIDEIFQELDKALHRAKGKVEMWSTLRTLGSERMSEPDYFPQQDTENVWVARVTYAVTTG